LHVDVVLDRCVVHSRAGYTLRALERWNIPTLNSASAVATCDDKAQTSVALEEGGLPTPRTFLAYSIEAALKACEVLGYPAVLKPVTGSWGRLLAKVNGPEQARAVMAQKEELGSFHHAIFYVQEFIDKPGRDIRAYVVGDRVLAASYRTSEHWITNAARGATSLPCPITPEIEELSVRACAAVGARLAGVDLIETDRGLTILEVNTGGEFRGLMSTTDVDIAAEIVDEAVRMAGKEQVTVD
jgi:[lysine-biosynthesis-protein LysW]--L-2-aminoadipate ligase